MLSITLDILTPANDNNVEVDAKTRDIPPLHNESGLFITASSPTARALREGKDIPLSPFGERTRGKGVKPNN